MIVYILKQTDEDDENKIIGVFSKKEQAEKARLEYDGLFGGHWPTPWSIEEHEVNYHVWKLKNHFGIKI